MKQAFVAWSGGKDCCRAAYKAQQEGYQIQYLLNMVNREVGRSCSHGIAARWIKLQSEAMGIPVMQPTTNGKDYQNVFVDTLCKLRDHGITYGVFGDIDFEPHREWNENVCLSAGMIPLLPLWKKNQDTIVRDFINLGFESIIVATRSDLLGQEWLGRKIDASFLQDLVDLNKNITPCGEAGEFHSLVIDGPLFQKRLKVLESEKIRREDHWILDIHKMDMVEK